ncbi:MAG: hypothetical protein NVSMB64_00320 [Candidatus Velthaea sp.]
MKRRFLDYLWCPTCHSDLQLTAGEESEAEIVQGELACGMCAASWPILKGVPRFIDGISSADDLRKVYADSFGHQWTTYDWLREEDELEFFSITQLAPGELQNKTVFDGGCGGGRFARVVAPLCGDFIGLDYSIAVDRAYELVGKRPNVLLVQSDINRNPIRSGLFDFVYSHGVIHHTPDTKKSFDNLPPLVKPGGTMYLAVFRKAIAPLRWSDSFWRSIINKLPIPAIDRICSALSVLAFAPKASFFKRFFWFSLQKTHEIRKCCLYDWYAPMYHHEHSVGEVQGWFRDAGFSNPRYINAWPYAPGDEKHNIPAFADNIRLGLLLGVIGTKIAAANLYERNFAMNGFGT